MSQAELDREAELAREEHWEYEQGQIARERYERELRERDRDHHSHRIPTPPFGQRPSRPPGDPPYRSREEQSYHREAPGPTSAPKLSRSGTPGSGSGSGTGDPASADSRNQLYERAYNRPLPQEEELSREDHRQSIDRNKSGSYRDAAPSGPSAEARKRNHHEMEVDGDAEPESPSVTGDGGSRKRIHQESSQEDEEDMDA